MNEPSNPPRRRAVALSHEGESPPEVVAKGYGSTAEAIIERAVHHGVYVHQSVELVNLLMNVNLDDQVPEALYLALAELLCWVHELDENAR